MLIQGSREREGVEVSESPVTELTLERNGVTHVARDPTPLQRWAFRELMFSGGNEAHRDEVFAIFTGEQSPD